MRTLRLLCIVPLFTFAIFAQTYLPFALSSVGLPSPQNCEWSIDVIASTTLKYRETVINNGAMLSMSAPIPVPNNPGLAGLSLFAQVIALDTDSNGKPSLFPSTAVKATIGAGAMIQATTVHVSKSNAAPTGRILKSFGIGLRLN